MVNSIERKQVRNENIHQSSIDNLVVHNTKSTQISSYSEDSSEKALQILNLPNFKRYNETKQKVESSRRNTSAAQIGTPIKIVIVPFVSALETLWTGKKYPNVMIRFRHGNNSKKCENNERFSGGGYYNCTDCCKSPCCCQVSPKLPKLEVIPCKYPQATFGDQLFHKHMNCKQSKASIPVKIPISLGVPVGLIQASSPTDTITPLLMRFAWYLKAMGLIFIKNIDKWTANDLDLIIAADDDSMDNDTDEYTKNKETYKDYLATESKIQKSFTFGGFRFKIKLDDGTWQENLKINIYDALHKFFKTNTYCLILFSEWYLLIWKENNIFFVLDMNGRNAKTLFTEEQQQPDNLPVLICLKKLINVIHLIVNLSKLDENESFLIRSIKITEVITPKGKVLTHQPDIHIPEYKTINDNYSYLKANFHLSLNPAKPEINRSGLPVGIAAMIASKIDHPATWDSKTLDRIICYGVNLCRACWPSCGNSKEPINLDKFLHCIHIGQFIANFELKSSAYAGFWKCRPVALRSEFHEITKTAFSKNENLLFQINNQMYAIWRKNNFYYLLDPYLHTVWGESTDIETKMATVRMFRNLENLLKVFNNILLQSNRSAKFYIHTLKVNGLVNCNDFKKEIDMSIEDDLKSLNEYIFFEDDYETCFNELGQASDYDDDIVSTVPSILSLSSSLDEGEEEEEEDENKNEDQKEDNKTNILESFILSQSNVVLNTANTGARIKFKKTSDIINDSKTKSNTDIKTHRNSNKISPKKSESKTSRGSNKKTDSKTNIKTDIKANTKYNININPNTNQQKEKYTVLLLKNVPKHEITRRHLATLDENVTKHKEQNTLDTCRKKLRDVCNIFNATDCQHKNSKLLERCTKSEYNYIKETCKIAKEKRKPDSKSHIFNSHDENICNKKRRPDPFLDHPTISQQPKNLIVSRSNSSTYESILKIFHSSLKCCDRVLISTIYGKFVVFRGHDYLEDLFFLYDGCTCDVNHFRHMDLSTGTAGLIPFSSLHKVVTYIMDKQNATGRNCTIHGHTTKKSTNDKSGYFNYYRI